MILAKLSGVQRAYLNNGAAFNRDVVKAGRVVRRGDPKNARGEMLRSLAERQRDADYQRTKQGREELARAIAEFGGPQAVAALATKCPTATAYGSRDPKKGKALPMQYFRHGGGY